MMQPEHREGLTLDDWNRYAFHREMVTNLLIEGRDLVIGQPPLELAIWGAGRCLDVDLARLIQSFAKIRLVDIRKDELEVALHRLQDVNTDKIECFGGIDLTGVSDLLEQIAGQKDASLIAEVAAKASSFPGPGTPPADVLVSNSMLTQLMNHVVETLGTSHPRFGEIALAIRNRHLDLLVAGTRPGGVAFLVTDVVSSETLPQLSPKVKNLPELLNDAIASSNFFHGANPFSIVHYLKTISRFRDRIQSVDASEPWIWDGPDNLFRAVTAIRIQFAT